jgi:hypothetical protein
MKKTLALTLIYLVFFIICLEAESVRLFNDSAYDLRAVIRGADNSFLGEMIIRSQNSTTWYNTYGPYESRTPVQKIRSQTPYKVVWYCLNGEQFSMCDTVATGGVAVALSCLGPRTCRSKERPNESVPEQEYPDMPYPRR